MPNKKKTRVSPLMPEPVECEPGVWRVEIRVTGLLPETVELRIDPLHETLANWGVAAYDWKSGGRCSLDPTVMPYLPSFDLTQCEAEVGIALYVEPNIGYGESKDVICPPEARGALGFMWHELCLCLLNDCKIKSKDASNPIYKAQRKRSNNRGVAPRRAL